MNILECDTERLVTPNSTHNPLRMIATRDLPQIGDRYQDTPTDSPRGKTPRGYEVVQRSLADGEHLCRLFPAEEELFAGLNWLLFPGLRLRTRGEFHESTLLFQGMLNFLAQCCMAPRPVQ
jgi:hypothetical protein